jgi:hypothetical protein
MTPYRFQITGKIGKERRISPDHADYFRATDDEAKMRLGFAFIIQLIGRKVCGKRARN